MLFRLQPIFFWKDWSSLVSWEVKGLYAYALARVKMYWHVQFHVLWLFSSFIQPEGEEDYEDLQ